MLGFSSLTFNTLRQYVILFGSLFNDIQIVRTDANNVTSQVINIPLSYDSKESMLTRVKQDPKLERMVAIQLPCASFEMKSPSYDSARHLQSLVYTAGLNAPDDKKSLLYQYAPVPYNVPFELYLYVKNAEDGTKAIEQVLPFFTPDFTVSANVVPQLGITESVPIVLNQISYEDVYQGDLRNVALKVWTLGFTLKGNIYGPLRNGQLIKNAKVNLYAGNTAASIAETITTIPVAAITLNANSTVTYYFPPGAGGGGYTVGETANVVIAANTSGNGVVVAQTANSVTLANVSGTVIEGNGSFIYNLSHVTGLTSGANCVITQALSYLYTSTPTANSTVSTPPYNIDILDDFGFNRSVKDVSFD